MKDHFDINPEQALLPFEEELKVLNEEIQVLFEKEEEPDPEMLHQFRSKYITVLEKIYKNLNNWDITQIARHPDRPLSVDYIDHLFNSFLELHGDRLFMDDHSTICGLADYKGRSVVVVAQQKGRTTEEKLYRNFGFPQPEGYRKALRIFKFAEKFKKPIITFIDTPGAFPGLDAEEHGQGEAIARNLREMAGLKVPVVSVVIGEGGSGGALGIGVSNYVGMLDYSIYSVISPEPCASILWRDANEKVKAANALKNDAKTALKLNVIDEIIKEPVGGAHRFPADVYKAVDSALRKQLKKFETMSPAQLVKQRLEKFENMGEYREISSVASSSGKKKSSSVKSSSNSKSGSALKSTSAAKGTRPRSSKKASK